MKKTLAAIALSLSFFLTACGGAVTEGTVTDKQYAEPYTTEEEIEECEWDTDTKTYRDSKGKTKTKKTKEYECEGTGEYEEVQHDAVYTIVIENEEGDTGKVEVSEKEYNSINEGDFYKED